MENFSLSRIYFKWKKNCADVPPLYYGTSRRNRPHSATVLVPYCGTTRSATVLVPHCGTTCSATVLVPHCGTTRSATVLVPHCGTTRSATVLVPHCGTTRSANVLVPLRNNTFRHCSGTSAEQHVPPLFWYLIAEQHVPPVCFSALVGNRTIFAAVL